MINNTLLLSAIDLPIMGNIFFHQPTLKEIAMMGESKYWTSVNLWIMKRSDIVKEENDFSRQQSDYDIWKHYILSSVVLKKAFTESVKALLRTKVEFFDISGTIYIGEKGFGVILDESFYKLVSTICSKMLPDAGASDDKGHFKETDNMTERERQMIQKMQKSAARIEQTKNQNKDQTEVMGTKILGLVAIGHYTFEQVYNMTMLQFNMLLQKYVEVQTFELRTALSPYMKAEEGQENSFWL